MQENVKELKIFKDKRGKLFEVLRSDDSIYEGKFGQALVSVNKPGIIKAWHRHKKQTDYTTCIKGKIRLLTAEEKRKGKIEIKEYELDGKKPVLVKVLPRTWHGYEVLGKKKAIVLYIIDVAYNAKNPDEERKEWNVFGAECWKNKPKKKKKNN